MLRHYRRIVPDYRNRDCSLRAAAIPCAATELSGIYSWQRQEIRSPLSLPDQFCFPFVTYPMASGLISPGIKQAEREADYPLQSPSETKNTWRQTSTYLCLPLAVLKQRCNITLMHISKIYSIKISSTVSRF